jgi:prepilin-type processing-associated H-X9-DG protein
MAITKVSASLVDLDGGVVINESSADADFRVESNGNANMLFVDGGNDRVGINGTGTNARGGSNTVALFDVSGSGKNYVEIQGATDSTANGLLFSDGSSGNYGVLGYDHANDVMNFFTAGSERMRIDSSGRILIGTTSSSGSSVRLEAHDATNPIIQVKDTTSNIICGIQAGNAEAVIRCPQDSPLVFNVGASETERMRIDSSGKVGIGTDSAVNKLDTRGIVSLGSGTTVSSVISRSVAPAGSQGMILTAGVITSEPVGDISRADNSSSGASIFLGGNAVDQYGGSVGLTAYGSGANGNLITFANRSGSTTTAERMRIAGNGFVQIGTTTAGGVFTVTNAMSTNDTLIQLNDAGGTGSHTQIEFRNTNGQVGTINTSGSATSYNTSSDARLKDVTGSARGLEVINELNPVAYNWKADGKADEGLIAQEVMNIVPNAVTGSEEDMYQMDYSKLVTPLIKAIQELSAEVEELKTKLESK